MGINGDVLFLDTFFMFLLQYLRNKSSLEQVFFLYQQINIFSIYAQVKNSFKPFIDQYKHFFVKF